tara:strand:- start:338 stop:1081 length:744 start_codon:yes stop_codon:yes gene_type:complete
MNEESSFSRRGFLATSAAVSTFIASNACADQDKPSLKKGDVVLFQGDSITDARRDKNRKGANDPQALGFGYPQHAAGGLLDTHRMLDLKIMNRGISGNKVPDLKARWQADALDLKPAVLSILIGVNDIWHKLNGRYDGTAEVYRDGFKALLAETKKALPDVTLVVCEPFVLRCGAVNANWFPDFDKRRGYAKQVAEESGAVWVPFQTMFDYAVSLGTAPAYWAGDGVHPSIAGHALMAKTWRAVVGI